jgi:hypothetical protein
MLFFQITQNQPPKCSAQYCVLAAVGFGPAIRKPFMNVHWADFDTGTER